MFAQQIGYNDISEAQRPVFSSAHAQEEEEKEEEEKFPVSVRNKCIEFEQVPYLLSALTW